MLAAYLIYTAWMTTCAAFAYAAIRRPATTNAKYIDYFALAFFGITLLLFGWLFIVQGITPFVQGNADSGRGYQDWHLCFLAFPYLRPLQKSPSPDNRNPKTGFRLFSPPNHS